MWPRQTGDPSCSPPKQWELEEKGMNKEGEEIRGHPQRSPNKSGCCREVIYEATWYNRPKSGCCREVIYEATWYNRPKSGCCREVIYEATWYNRPKSGCCREVIYEATWYNRPKSGCYREVTWYLEQPKVDGIESDLVPKQL